MCTLIKSGRFLRHASMLRLWAIPRLYSRNHSDKLTRISYVQHFTIFFLLLSLLPFVWFMGAWANFSHRLTACQEATLLLMAVNVYELRFKQLCRYVFGVVFAPLVILQCNPTMNMYTENEAKNYKRPTTQPWKNNGSNAKNSISPRAPESLQLFCCFIQSFTFFFALSSRMIVIVGIFCSVV